MSLVLLCDADGNLFPSEEPAFEASASVTNRLLAELGVPARFTSDELRRRAMGRNFRATAVDLAAGYGVALDSERLDRYVEIERREVIARLRRTLRPDPAVLEPLALLSQEHRLAVVSSSASARLDACFRVTGLDGLFPAELRFSAEDSLPAPASKPDPAIYLHAGRMLEVHGEAALAVEDAPSGVRAAVAAGFPVVGNVFFAPPGERSARAAELRAAGASAIVESWWDVQALLASEPVRS